MSKVYLYHNPRCSKSREVLALLKARDIEIDIRLYLETGLAAEEICLIQRQLNIPFIEMIRSSESIFSALSLSDASSDDVCIKALLEHPILLQRPIVLRGAQGVIGRPPELVMQLFEGQSC